MGILERLADTLLPDTSPDPKTIQLIIQSANENKLIAAAQQGDCSTISHLLEQKVDINYAYRGKNNSIRTTALGNAAFYNHINAVTLLISKGANVNLTSTKDGANVTTPLQTAAFKGHSDILNELINAKADLNYRAKQNEPTALMIAITNNHLSCAEALIQAGANPYFEDKFWKKHESSKTLVEKWITEKNNTPQLEEESKQDLDAVTATPAILPGFSKLKLDNQDNRSNKKKDSQNTPATLITCSSPRH